MLHIFLLTLKVRKTTITEYYYLCNANQNLNNLILKCFRILEELQNNGCAIVFPLKKFIFPYTFFYRCFKDFLNVLTDLLHLSAGAFNRFFKG